MHVPVAGTQSPTFPAPHEMAAQLAAISRPAQQLELAREGLSLVVYGGDLERVLAALTIATGAAASGEPASLFFTFWGTAALRKPGVSRSRSWLERALGWMLPTGHRQLKLSQMHMGGLGTAMIKWRMRKKNFAGVAELLEMCEELGVQINVCDMSMDLLGMSMDDLIDYPGIKLCGVTTFLEEAGRSKVSLFI